LPSRLGWPHYEHETYGPIPLVFLAQIDLSKVPMPSAQSGLPESGTLFFFFEPRCNFDHEFTAGAARVWFAPEDVSECRARKRPKYSAAVPNFHPQGWIVDSQDGDVPRWNFSFQEIVGYDTSSVHNQELYAAASGKAEDAREAVREIYQNQKGTRTALAPKLHNMFVGPYASGWEKGQIPLLTIWHDANLSLSHGDQRILVYSISEEDLLNHDFNNVCLHDAG
jgi:uncharacterized protein YwqG